MLAPERFRSTIILRFTEPSSFDLIMIASLETQPCTFPNSISTSFSVMVMPNFSLSMRSTSMSASSLFCSMLA